VLNIADAISVHEGVQFNGVTVIKEFLTTDEEAELASHVDSAQWVESQSGRRKQDFGPKINFKKRKVTSHHFKLPDYIRPFVQRMNETMQVVPVDQCTFQPVELCNLDYDPSRGSSIDPHLDDEWIWGERLVTINLLSSTVLTFTHPLSHGTLAVHLPMPSRSLVVVQGLARHEWKHSILRENIHHRRLAMTLRELSDSFLKGGDEENKGQMLLSMAQL
jgi:alkylated DNA repair protein alkB family protein 4